MLLYSNIALNWQSVCVCPRTPIGIKLSVTCKKHPWMVLSQTKKKKNLPLGMEENEEVALFRLFATVGHLV